MSVLAIRRALEDRLNAIVPSLPTAYENVEFSSVSGQPFQKAFLLPGNSESPTVGDALDLVHESGIFQVSLYYPLGKGMKLISERVEVIREAFPKGLTLTSGGVDVRILKRASVAPANRDGEWTVIPVSIPYFSHVFA